MSVNVFFKWHDMEEPFVSNKMWQVICQLFEARMMFVSE
jgi:hypothetical protein